MRNIHRVERHGNDADDEVGDCLVDDEDDEVRAQLLLVLERQENEEVGHGADCGEDEENGGYDDHRRADMTTD